MPTTTRPARRKPATCTGCLRRFSAASPAWTTCSGDQPRVSISPDQLDLFGIRSIDPPERKLVRDRRIAVADMRAIDEFGVGVLIRRVIERVRRATAFCMSAFDVDFLDPAVAPGVGTTVPGGATYREAHLVMELLHDSGLVRSVDIVELNPFLDERGRTARVAVELIGSLFGLRITDRPTPSNAVFPTITEARGRRHAISRRPRERGDPVKPPALNRIHRRRLIEIACQQ